MTPLWHGRGRDRRADGHPPGRPILARGLTFAAGLVVHLATTTAFGYLLCFLLDARVPRTIDRGGPAAGPMDALAVNVALLMLFALPHSVLARTGAKARLAAIAGPPLVRATYNLVAVLTMAALFRWWHPMPAVLWALEGVPALAMRAAFWGGWVLCALAALGTNLWELTGLRQSWAALRGREHTAVSMKMGGAYGLVRHPLYSGFVLALWATPRLSVGHALFAGVLTLYILVAIPFEERDLARALGPDYAAYRSRVPALFPRFWRRM